MEFYSKIFCVHNYYLAIFTNEFKSIFVNPYTEQLPIIYILKEFQTWHRMLEETPWRMFQIRRCNELPCGKHKRITWWVYKYLAYIETDWNVHKLFFCEKIKKSKNLFYKQIWNINHNNCHNKVSNQTKSNFNNLMIVCE